ncbi:MAG: MBL fold metallo-hydrolase [Balneolaceae bacterium]
MKITFLGTGTSMGVPVAGGFGSELMEDDPRNERYRCSAWIRSEESSVIIDTSPEFRLQTIRSGVKHIDLVLITHEHMDHIAGLDDLRAFNYAQKESIPLYTSKQTADSIKRRFDYMFGENKYPGSTSIDIHPLEINKAFTFQDLNILPLSVNHGPIDILGFRINDFVYMTDTKKVPEKTKELVKGARLMVLSGLRWGPRHPTHLTIPEAIEVADELEISQTYLIHMNTYVNHKKSAQKLPDHVKLAYDQLTVEI